MPVTMGGMASGIDTEAVIKKLVEVEAKPIKKWEEEKSICEKRKLALNELKSFLIDLSNSAKELYGFRASYDDKKAISSNTNVLQATANKFASTGIRKIETLGLASAHKIATDPIPKNKKLPSGKFKIEINGESEIIKFRGGKLKSLQSKIDEIASDLINTSYIKTFDENYILTLESNTSGQKGEIKITGDKKFLKNIGLIKGEKGEKKQRQDLIFDKKYFTSYIGEKKPETQNGSLEVEKGGRSIIIQSVLWQEYALPVNIPVKKNTLLEFDILYKGIEEKKEEVLPFKIEIGPEERVVIKGIELEGYNITRVRPIERKEKKKDIVDLFGIGVVSYEKGERLEKIYLIDKSAKGKQKIPIGRDFADKNINKVIFFCNEGEAKFLNAKILTPIKGIGILDPKNIIAKAKDAKLKIDGIEIIRDRNNNLDDIIKGVTLDIRDKSKYPVTLTIEPDIDKAIEKIKNFVKNYNNYLAFNRELTKAEKISKPGEYKKIKYQSGLFVGDMTISRLENTLRTSIGGAYPNIAEKPIRILPQIGISTGEINAPWESIKEGKLVIKEETLYNCIRDNPEGVNEFFGSDTDGDNRIDNGFAYRIQYILTPYIKSGKNIIVSKIDLEDNTIKSTEARIERYQDHLAKYEDRLRRKFAAMEKSISGSKKQREWIGSQMKSLPDINKNKKDR